jgi:hypothetical protein
LRRRLPPLTREARHTRLAAKLLASRSKNSALTLHRSLAHFAYF